MATIKTSDADLKYFVPSDPYFYTTDNRPLRELQTNIAAINSQVEDVVESDCEEITWIVESPSVEEFSGGIHSLRNIGTPVRAVVSMGIPGSSGSVEIDIKKNGTSIFATPGDRPVLAFNDADKMVESVNPNIAAVAAAAGDRFNINVISTHAGSPRWLRVSLWVRKSQSSYTAFP